MKKYDVTVEFYDEYKGCYIIEANNKDEAKKEALRWATEDLSVVSIEEFENGKSYSQRPYATFKHYFLVQVDEDDGVWCMLESHNLDYLMKIAESISVSNTKRIEIRGTDEPVDTHLSYGVVFAKSL